MLRGRWVVGLLVLAWASAPASASAQFPGTDLQPLSVAADGGVPDGPSRNPAISQDRRNSSLAAYESDATNIVTGAGATTNVYVVGRAAPYGDDGTAWRAGRTVLASVGLAGEPANGPSTRPSLSGTSRVPPRCVAFVSAASNLVRGDTNGTPDAFVRFLDTGVTRRVSVNSRGRQSSGTVTEVAVNGLCTRVAFVSDGGDVALTRTRKRSWRSARTRPSPAGRRQVYLRSLPGPSRLDKALRGLTFLASATDGGVPGDADSYDIALSTNSRALTYATDASNLTGFDGNGQSDIYQRTMERGYLPKRKHRRAQHLVMETQLISSNGDGAAANGASRAPANNTTGLIVAFQTTAPDLIGRDTGGATQVVQATVGSGGIETKLASGTARGSTPGNAASSDPSLTAGGTWVVFQSDASDVGSTTTRGPDLNATTDAMLFTAASGERWLVAEGSNQPTTNPMTSPHGNYIVFERGGQVHLLHVGER